MKLRGLSLSPMDESHVADVLAMELRAYPFPWTEGIFRDSLRAGYSAWVVHDANGQLVGYALMAMGAGEAHILNLCVEPLLQRMGIGSFLLAHLKEVARAAGAQLLLLEVRKSNRAAIQLYMGAGFRRLGQRSDYYPAEGGREDAWLLGHDLDTQSEAA